MQLKEIEMGLTISILDHVYCPNFWLISHYILVITNIWHCRMFSGGMDLTFVFVCCPSNNGLRWDGGGQHLDYPRLHLIRQVVSLLSTLLLPPKLGTRDLWTEVVGYY